MTKDGDDYYPMSVRFGWPPKVIWFNVGNCSTTLIEEQLRGWATHIKKFGRNKEEAMLVIGRSPPGHPS